MSNKKKFSKIALLSFMATSIVATAANAFEIRTENNLDQALQVSCLDGTCVGLQKFATLTVDPLTAPQVAIGLNFTARAKVSVKDHPDSFCIYTIHHDAKNGLHVTLAPGGCQGPIIGNESDEASDPKSYANIIIKKRP